MEVLDSRVVSGAPQCVGVSEILLVPPGDIVTAAGPSIPSSQDSILLSPGGGRGVRGRGGEAHRPLQLIGQVGSHDTLDQQLAQGREFPRGAQTR